MQSIAFLAALLGFCRFSPVGDFAIGRTMVFLKPQAAKQLVRMQREALATWEPLVGLLESVTVYKRGRKLFTERSLPATRICANIRRKLVQAQIKVVG